MYNSLYIEKWKDKVKSAKDKELETKSSDEWKQNVWLSAIEKRNKMVNSKEYKETIGKEQRQKQRKGLVMNEKIKELAELCGMNPIDDMTEFGMGESMNRYNCQGFMLEKFAELIAKECICVAYTTYWNNPETVKGIHFKEAIMQRFGIE